MKPANYSSRITFPGKRAVPLQYSLDHYLLRAPHLWTAPLGITPEIPKPELLRIGKCQVSKRKDRYPQVLS